MTRLAIANLSQDQLQELMTSLGEPAFRATQLLKWVYRSRAISFNEMTDLPSELRRKLAVMACVQSITPLDSITSDDGKTIKTLFRLRDNETIESVFMSYDPMGAGRGRRTACVSTQVGCAFGCPFCATGQQGFKRNLTSGEIVDQVLYFSKLRLREGPGANQDTGWKRPPINNVVFMGMGEPLANYEATLQAVENLNKGFGLGVRHMTISTVGLVPQIRRLARARLQIGLSISLHAPNDELRQRLVPMARKHPLGSLVDACRDYISQTGRRITFEYVLLEGLNDSPRHAAQLAHLLRGLNCHVNLIPANPATESPFKAPARQTIAAFQQELSRHHIPNTLRVERGVSIAAGCGQLRGRLSETS
ncbi:MAG: 23S rRNA (adenine(2503)-C(2))-methyltransferase RlmN [Chloroflexota bacterium]